MSNATAEMTMTPEQAMNVRDAALFTLGTSQWFLDKLTGDLSGDEWVHQPCNGANHALWNIGHLAASDKSFLDMLGGSTSAVPESYNELFGMGSEPKGALSAYPAPAEVVKVFQTVRGELIAHAKAMTGAQLAAATPNEQMAQVAPTLAQFLNFMVLHDSTHAGQICIARKSLGKSHVLGGE